MKKILYLCFAVGFALTLTSFTEESEDSGGTTREFSCDTANDSECTYNVYVRQWVSHGPNSGGYEYVLDHTVYSTGKKGYKVNH